MTAVVAPDLAGSPPEIAIAELSARLKQVQSQRQRRSELQERRQKSAADLAKAERTVREKDRLLTQLCEEAGCALPDELSAAEDRSQLRARLQGELDSLDKQLAELARGEPMVQFLAAAAVWQTDQLDAELVGLQARIDDAVGDKEAATECFVTERNWLQAHDGAALAAEEAEAARRACWRRHQRTCSSTPACGSLRPCCGGRLSVTARRTRIRSCAGQQYLRRADGGDSLD